jgi:hypothetical protein
MPYSSREHRTEYNRTWRDWYKAHGICIKCHERDSEPGHIHCAKCLKTEVVRRLPTRGRDNVKHKRLREERIAAGLCPYCGNKATEGMKSCARCRAKRNDSVRKRRIILRIEREAEMARNGK